MSAPAVERATNEAQGGGSFAELGHMVLDQCEELRQPTLTIDVLRMGCRLGNAALARALMQGEGDSEAFNTLDARVEGFLNTLTARLRASTPVSDDISVFELSARTKTRPATPVSSDF